jgi:hypothetical protein
MRVTVSIAVLAAALAVAGCKKSEPVVEATAEATLAPAAATAAPLTLESLVGTYEVTDAKGAPVDTTEIRADGGYTETPMKGLKKSGVVSVVDGKSCFDPSGKEAATCFTHGPVGADGSFTATGPDGVVLTVKPKA